MMDVAADVSINTVYTTVQQKCKPDKKMFIMETRKRRENDWNVIK